MPHFYMACCLNDWLLHWRSCWSLTHILKIKEVLFVFALVRLHVVTYRQVSCTRTGAWVSGRCSVCRSWTVRSCRFGSVVCSPCQSRNNFSCCAVRDHCAGMKPWSVRCGSPARAAPPPSWCRDRQIARESNRHPAPNLTPNQRSETLSLARKTSPALPSLLLNDLLHNWLFQTAIRSSVPFEVTGL